MCTVDHKPWQEKGFPVPKALRETAIDILKERLRNRIVKYSHRPYQNPWFLVKKTTPGY